MINLVSNFANQESYKRFVSEINIGKQTSIVLKGLTGSAKSMLAANFTQQNSNANIFILSDSDDAAYFYDDLFNITKNENVLYFPSSYKHATQSDQTDASNIIQRTNALNALKDAKRSNICIVTYPEALAEKVVSLDVMQKNTLHIKKGEKTSIDFICEMLATYGFERTDFVYEPGQYAVRGSIVDIFSFATNKPYRIDFFGDEIESIRDFDINTQLSVETIDQIEVISNLKKNEQDGTFFDFLQSNANIWFADFDMCRQSIEGAFNFSEEKFISTSIFIENAKKFNTVLFASTNVFEGTKTLDFKTSPQPSFNKNFELLLANIKENEKNGYITAILFDNISQSERLQQIFMSLSGSEKSFFESINVSIHEGFVDHNSKTCFYTDHQIFQRYHRFSMRGALDKSDAISIQELNNLQIGDYIVHIDHGIGVFGGLVKQNVNGKIQESIKLVYKDNDVLFVNINGLHRISKYKSKDGEPPKIYKLGNGEWQRLKIATKKKVKDIAQELIALYAKRKATQGYAYAPDSYMQHELEASFIYEDTPDQLKATRAVKEDMESQTPMDRLVCGDVGFGKTEVAIRAAFKAASEGKQVAVLVPTTILALQHKQTFSERLHGFPIVIDFLNRFKTAKQQTETLQNLENGKIDIIIGTHRLLSKNVVFKDLGLLIIDEEQKFGVSAKEKLRKLKLNVDTLTLTATPIPRTLQFSLLGARDLSIINTPPPNRHPIVTEVHTFNEDIIRDAIKYEVERGGQVFFIHNRVQDIERVKDIIQRACPKVRIAVGHGQMESRNLEEIMLAFINGEYDVLLSTTIVESGLDIPNANTIIVDQAQNFGLSDLHQLRGRVGRSNRKAFCYLLTPPPISLTSDARRRLKAIEDFSELGSGFNIAMQDLDIRGAGNLLGGEQSGFIADIGFETYQRILNEALAELKSDSNLPQEEKDRLAEVNINYISDCYIDTDLEAFLPDEYVSNSTEKLKLYKELNGLANEDELQNFATQLIDRFGEIPAQTQSLFNIVRIRQVAINLGFERIVLRNSNMVAYFISDKNSTYFQTRKFSNILKYIQQKSQRFKLKESNQKLSLSIPNVRTIEGCLKILQDMKKAIDN